MKKETDYFETFSGMARASVKASEQLFDLVSDYRSVSEKAAKIHDTEHEADSLMHRMMDELNRAFITPIDREDIIAISDKLDSITDSIEDISNLFDMLSVSSIPPEALVFSELIVRCCKCLVDLVDEFKSFKHSKVLNDKCIEVNKLEEEGDRLHRSIIKALYKSGSDVLEIIKWKEIYDTMEDALDLCEDAADLLAGLAIKNG